MSDFTTTHKLKGRLLIGKPSKWETTVVHNPSGESHTIVTKFSQTRAAELCKNELKKKLDLV